MKVSRIIAAPARRLYDACTDPEALAAWLPPTGMRGEVRRFDGRVGGGYEMTLTYEDGGGRGKTTADSDKVAVRFVALVPGERIVQAADFASDDPAYGGEMRMIWTFAPVNGGTEVSVRVENAPPGISEADHRVGIEASLANLARFVTAP